MARLLNDEPAGIADERKHYPMTKARHRSRSLVVQLREIYSGECQVCRWAPKRTYGADLCEADHVRWVSRGGPDSIGNRVLLCPNHHRAVHRCDAPFDFGKMGFLFGDRIEALGLLEHELAA